MDLACVAVFMAELLFKFTLQLVSGVFRSLDQDWAVLRVYVTADVCGVSSSVLSDIFIGSSHKEFWTGPLYISLISKFVALCSILLLN